MVRKVHTKEEKSLHADTITAFLQCRINFDSHDFAVGKLFFQTLQVLHHVGIASRQMPRDLPQAFERKVTHLNTFVKPARPTDNVRDEIVNGNISWAENVGQS